MNLLLCIECIPDSRSMNDACVYRASLFHSLQAYSWTATHMSSAKQCAHSTYTYYSTPSFVFHSIRIWVGSKMNETRLSIRCTDADEFISFSFMLKLFSVLICVESSRIELSRCLLLIEQWKRFLVYLMFVKIHHLHVPTYNTHRHRHIRQLFRSFCASVSHQKCSFYLWIAHFDQSSWMHVWLGVKWIFKVFSSNYWEPDIQIFTVWIDFYDTKTSMSPKISFFFSLLFPLNGLRYFVDWLNHVHSDRLDNFFSTTSFVMKKTLIHSFFGGKSVKNTKNKIKMNSQKKLLSRDSFVFHIYPQFPKYFRILDLLKEKKK